MGSTESVMNLVVSLIALSGLAAWLPLILSRCLELAPYRIGWTMYLSNVLLETAEKRLSLNRWWLEAGLTIVVAVVLSIGLQRWWVGLAVVLLQLLLALKNLLEERHVVNQVYATQETVGLRGGGDGQAAERYPAPGLHPRLCLNLEGPFIERLPEYQLGLVALDQPFQIQLLIGNHSRVPCQTPVAVEIQLPSGWNIVDGELQLQLPAIASGQVQQVCWRLVSTKASVQPQSLRICVRGSRFEGNLQVHSLGTRTVQVSEIESVEISRYPGGRRSAFSLRGDFDLYDTASFQTIEGLEAAFGLSMRYGMAQTMYLSTRLSLDQQAAAEWADHYSIARGADQIPEFIQWMREHVELCYSAAYPVRTSRRYAIELGNHGHLHYDTDASGAPGNQWLAGAKAGQGQYPWQGADRSSLADQRDNMLEAARWCQQLFQYVPRSWAKPGRGNDRFSPAAVQAAGCEVATGSDISPKDNVLRQPAPHHPSGTSIVELTARYPSDPQHIQHAAMLRFWIYRGHRLARPLVLLVHQHLRQFDGVVCQRMTEWLLHQAVHAFHGDLFVDTVYGVGRYWLDVLSPLTKQVRVQFEDSCIKIHNDGTRALSQVPVDVRLKSGQRLTRLVDLPAHQTLVIAL
ncbi:MAG: hypothetical protein KF752_20305 [Pirellulaceae bacterium]|nr:hypothetical protein [Pirellulaceae bacterium]